MILGGVAERGLVCLILWTVTLFSTLVTRRGSRAVCFEPSDLRKTVWPGDGFGGGLAGGVDCAFLASLTCHSFSSLMARLVPELESRLK